MEQHILTTAISSHLSNPISFLTMDPHPTWLYPASSMPWLPQYHYAQASSSYPQNGRYRPTAQPNSQLWTGPYSTRSYYYQLSYYYQYTELEKLVKPHTETKGVDKVASCGTKLLKDLARGSSHEA